MSDPGDRLLDMRALDRFSAPTRAWFEASFASPTPAQEGAWDAIAAGKHALVVAPTGSGKTLSAFLHAIDRLLSTERPDDKTRRTRVLYISPLKALGVDVERNLRAPLTGIRNTAERLEAAVPDVTVGLRSGDTSPADRRRLGTTPPDILITTPESLFLMLTSQARETLRGVDTVIIDEVHAVAGTKRGSHLGISLERLDHLLDQPAQRIGLSATVRPLEEVARFLGGTQPVEIVSPPSTKEWDLRVVVPVEDMTMPEEYDEESGDPGRATSTWPHVEEHVVDLVEQHRSTIVFANSRRLAEFFAWNKVTLQVPGYASPVDYLQEQGYLARADYIPLRPSVDAEVEVSSAEEQQIREGLDLPEAVIKRLETNDRRNLLILSRVMDEAEASGLTYSDWIASVLAEKVGYELSPGFATGARDSLQEEIPMQTAS